MSALEEGDCSEEASAKARRAKRIILWVMALFILLPFLLVWMTGAVRF